MNNRQKLNIVFPEDVKKYVKLQCNNKLRLFFNPPEFKRIKDFLKKLNPKVVLEMGSGIGRASVCLFKYFNWENTLFILADGDSGEKQLSGMRKWAREYYNSLDATESFCRANKLNNFRIFNLEKSTWKDLSCKPDLVYSFYALGFHWPINQFLIDIYPFLENKCNLIFGLRGTSYAKKWVDNQVNNIDYDKYRIINNFFDPEDVESGSIILERK